VNATTFITEGDPRAVARTIEEFARATGHVTALVVPWESDATALTMSVTSMKADGWAIEHTDLGTIRLAGTSPGTTSIDFIARDLGADAAAGLSTLFVRFTTELQRRLASAAADGTPRGDA
jgi:hypothetical protein